MNKDDQNTETNNTAKDQTPKVIGIGGIFFFTDNLQQTRDWYSKNLGFEINAWGSTGFESPSPERPGETSQLQWTPFKRGDEYFAPSTKDFMINYRVQHLEALVVRLRKNGVTILDDIAMYDYGKFIHIMDPEGNKIELWEEG